MLPIINFANRSILKRLTDAPVVLAFDFDGVLSPVVADRHAAAMRPETAMALKLLCNVYPVAVISGRSRADLESRLSGAPVKYTFGNHGLEPGHDLDVFAHEVETIAPLLEASLHTGNQGVEIENKRYSLAVHYRRARNRGLARRSIERAVAALPQPMRTLPGELAINVLPRHSRSKADAVAEVCVREQAPQAIFVGDGVTDEDVFSSHVAPRSLPSYFAPRVTAIQLGSNISDANFFLRNQGEVDVLLEWLFALRTAH